VSGSYQSKLTLMSESLRNDGRVWVPLKKDDKRRPADIPDAERDYYLERVYPSFGNLAPRDVSSRQAKFRVDEGRGVGSTGVAVYLDFRDAIRRYGEKRFTELHGRPIETNETTEAQRLGKAVVSEKYGNLFEMYEKITGENPYEMPMRIYPAVHYTMGGLWVDYNLQSTIPGLHVLGEANFSDHGANRLGASALMQGLADGYFIIPYTIGHFLASTSLPAVSVDHEAFRASRAECSARLDKFLGVNGSRTVDDFHRALGHVMWEKVGMSRNAVGLQSAIAEIGKLREEFWQDVKVVGEANYKNHELEKAGRVADFLELGELMARDALERNESCGGHFREEFQTPDNEAQRDDDRYCHVAAWEATESSGRLSFKRHMENLQFEFVKLSTRSYK
jgi:succinate dehydrogenase / fumarate reductase flavoprotein subunit